ncbi:hypothetical protein FACS1894218_5680 [Bacilli bacterium]|nr:hypothetical protein FACS1894218_5680 [Bacilli bacterium]
MIKITKKSYRIELQPNNIKNIAIYYTGYPKEKTNFILDTLSAGFGFLKEKILIRALPSTIVAHTHRGAYGFTVETDIMRKNSQFN